MPSCGAEGLALQEEPLPTDARLHTMPCCAGGIDTELLEEELAAQQRAAVAAGQAAHSGAGLVSLLVKPRIEIVNKDKLVASKGKLITVTGERCVCADRACMFLASLSKGKLIMVTGERCVCW